MELCVLHFYVQFIHGPKSFLNLLLLAVLSKGGFMRSALSVVYSITLIGGGDVFVYCLSFHSF